MSKETKLGLFVLVATFFLVLIVLLLGNFSFRGGYYIYLVFDDIAGVPNKASVKVAGVDVGAVRGITLENGKARIKSWIRNDVKIHRDAQASVGSTGLIGSKYVELTVGSPGAPLLENGDTIVGVTPVPLDKAVAQVMQKIDRLVGSFEGAGGRSLGQNLNETLDNLRQVSEVLRDALAHQEQKIAEIIDNVHDFTGDLSDITSENRENIKAAIVEIRHSAEKLDRVLAKLDRGEGTIGKLMSDEQMGEDLKATFTDLRETTKQAKNVLRRLNLIETSWNYELRYDYKYDVRRHDAGLYISPRPGKFYYLGGSNLGENTGSSKLDPEPMNTYNVLIGQQFGPVQVYAGILRSKGGLGMKVKPFWKWDPLRRLEVTAEGYNFFRETPVSRPNINAGGRVELAHWAYVGAQLEDVYYSSAFNAYANLVFRDDDIAYILGLVGLAKP